MSVLNKNPADPALALDVLVPIQQLLVAAARRGATPDERVLSRLLPYGEKPLRIFVGALDYDNMSEYAIVVVGTGMDRITVSCTAEDYVRMLCWGTSGDDGTFDGAAEYMAAASSVLWAVNREVVNGKMIHSVGLGDGRTQLDPTTSRPYIDIELTILSDIRRMEP